MEILILLLAYDAIEAVNHKRIFFFLFFPLSFLCVSAQTAAVPIQLYFDQVEAIVLMLVGNNDETRW